MVQAAHRGSVVRVAPVLPDLPAAIQALTPLVTGGRIVRSESKTQVLQVRPQGLAPAFAMQAEGLHRSLPARPIRRFQIGVRRPVPG